MGIAFTEEAMRWIPGDENEKSETGNPSRNDLEPYLIPENTEPKVRYLRIAFLISTSFSSGYCWQTIILI